MRLPLEAVLVYMQSLNNIRKKNQLKVVGQVRRCKKGECLDKGEKTLHVTFLPAIEVTYFP